MDNNKEAIAQKQAAEIFKVYAKRNAGRQVKIVGQHSHSGETATILGYKDTGVGPAIRLKDHLCEFYAMRLSNLQLVN